MKRILIAGQNGTIGSFLSDVLSTDYNIIGIGKGEFGSSSYTNIDLLNIREVGDFIKSNPKFDNLIFLVGLAHDKGKNQDYPVFEKVNFITLFNLLESCKKYDKIPDKIIFSSTISVYGEKLNKEVYSENDKLLPSSPYAKTKILAEKYLEENFNEKSWVLRFAPVYSDDFTLNIDRRTRIKGRFYKVGKGENKLSLLNIKNISYTIKEILNGNIPPSKFNLADEKIYSYNELIKGVNAVNVLQLPSFLFRIVYFLGQLSNNIFLKENSIKLLTDNIYSTEKLKKYISLPYSLNQ